MSGDEWGTLKCPFCGHEQRMRVPQTSCQAFYKCSGCGKVVAAEKECCVFCEYGDVKCPGHNG
ncbi:hypothetical protein D6764_04700 [Candidatus Woesearchaeota archaeon]|nr:MAG: hypothetical protein D6764_04700 [Candidatus Woesearchaeota archaeon]